MLSDLGEKMGRPKQDLSKKNPNCLLRCETK